MNQRAEIINKKSYDPYERQEHCDNVVFVTHVIFELACRRKDKGIPGFRLHSYIIKSKYYRIYL